MKKVLIASVTLACTLSYPQNASLADEAINQPTVANTSISTPDTNNTGETTNVTAKMHLLVRKISQKVSQLKTMMMPVQTQLPQLKRKMMST